VTPSYSWQIRIKNVDPPQLFLGASLKGFYGVQKYGLARIPNFKDLTKGSSRNLPG
jgi:hypothetical protein